jgi:cell division protein FtsI/penicillin-binding protein 2
VTGYYSLRYGTSGLEDAYDAHLRGTVGPHDGLPGWLAELMHRPAFGEAITATIYLPAQLAAHEAMVQAGGTGAVVVVDADAGELRVMVSEPTFDANQLESHWDELVADPAAPLINRATQGIFPLGELSRLIVMLALAEAGHELPPAADQIPPADLIEPLSGAELAAMAEQLQFDQPLPFALPTEGAPIPTDLPNKVGEVAATPFHIAMVGLALMSGGAVTEPLFVTDPAPAAIPSLRLMSAETAGQVAPYAADLTGLALPEVTGNEPLSWYLGLIDATETQPALVIVVVVSTAELDQAAAQRIGQMTLAAFQAP